MRIRITFEKNETLKHISHLDLYRTFERTIRRAELPLAYTKGFKPHPKINIAAALPLGFICKNDLLDIWLVYDLFPQDILVRLRKVSPIGLTIKTVNEIGINEPTLQSQLIAFEYRININQKALDMEKNIQGILNTQQLVHTRNGKNLNIRPQIIDIKIPFEKKNSKCNIIMLLTASAGNFGRPEEVLEILGLDKYQCMIERTRLILSNATNPLSVKI